MGLEAVNFFYCSSESVKEIVENNTEIIKVDDKRYVYKKESSFWIDIELQNNSCLSIRITLCNPKDKVLNALDILLSYFFTFKDGVLHNLNTKEVFKEYNTLVKEKIADTYGNRKKVFEDMYGDYTAAISSEEFYRIQRANRGIKE